MAEEKAKIYVQHETVVHNDNESLIDRTNESELQGNFGVHAGMAAIMEIRKHKEKYEKTLSEISLIRGQIDRPS